MRMNYMGQYLVLALFAFVVMACQNPTTVGSDLLSDIDNLNPTFTDTISIDAVTVRDDSIFTVQQSRYLTGSMADPVFGKTYGGIYLQPLLPSSNINIGKDLVLDSVTLRLRYPGVYGDKSVKPSFFVYRVRERFYRFPIGIYRNYQTFSLEPEPIGYEANVNLRPSDSSYVEVTLNRSFGEELLSQSGTENFTSGASFLNYLNGLYLVPDTSNGYGQNMMSIDMFDDFSGLYLHFRNELRDSLLTIFPVSANSGLVNYFTHQYDNQEILDQINSDPVQTEKVYIQGMGGLAAKVSFPGFSSLGKVAINKAELVLTVLPSEADSVFIAPETILPRFKIDSTRTFSELEDQEFSESYPFYDVNGEREEVMINGTQYFQYRINLARYFQNLARGETPRPIYLKVAPAASSGGRAVIAGPDYPDDRLKMRLRLFYTRK